MAEGAGASCVGAEEPRADPAFANCGVKEGVWDANRSLTGNNHARTLFCALTELFSSPYQQASFRVLMALFLRAAGQPKLRRATTKSASALLRFLNTYCCNTRSVIRHTRNAAIDSLFAYHANRRGRRPRLLVMLDLTSLEKAGRFMDLGLVRTLNKKRGLHLVLMYLVVGPLRIPWALRVWRGKGSKSASELAVTLLRTLPRRLTRRFSVLVLALRPALLGNDGLPWSELAREAVVVFLPVVVVLALLAELEKRRSLLEGLGMSVSIRRFQRPAHNCKI